MKKPDSVTQNIGKVSMRAQVEASTIDLEKRTVEVVWTTGARVLRGSYDPFYEELSLEPGHVRMDRFESGSSPLLDTHSRYDTSSVIGVIEAANISGNEGRATIRFAKDEASDLVFQKVVDGILKNVSVGYRTYRMEMREESINDLPIYRAIDWEPQEISMVPIGADADAGVRTEEARNSCEFFNPLAKERQMPKKKEETKEIATETRAVEVKPDIEALKREAIAADRERSAAVQRLADTLNLTDGFAQRSIASESTLDEIRAAAFDEHAARAAKPIDGAGRIENVEDKRDKWMRGASDWLIQRSALSDIVTRAAKKRGEDVKIEPGEFRGLSLCDLARESLENVGRSTRGMDRMALVGAALTHRAAGQSTSDFSVLLENVMNKSLLSAYELEEDTWRKLCSIGSVSDFRAHNRYRRGSFGALDTVAEGGEFQRRAVDDARKESLTASTKGNLIAITRQAIINDDMGAFNSLAVEIGQMAGLSIEVDFYALLALNAGLGPLMNDAVAMFDAAHSNIGVGAALSTASLDADDAIMGAQQDDNANRYLNIKPSILLIPRGFKMQANQLNESQYEVDTAARKAQIPNSVQGLFDEIVATPYLTGTRRYMFADPRRVPAIEVAFLNGQQSPYLEMKNGWDVDGVEWKVRLDYALGAVDYKSALTNAGV